MEFPQTIAAVEKAETTDRWAIGAALIKEIGKPPPSGIQDASKSQFVRCSAELALYGFEYTPGTLRKIRGVTATFPPGTRTSAASFEAHMAAGNPEMMALIVKAARGRAVTKSFARAQSKAVRAAQREADAVERSRLADEAAERRAEAERLRAAADREADERRAAKLAAEAALAEQDADEAEDAAEHPTPGRPTPRQVSLAVVRNDLVSLAADAVARAERATALWNRHVNDFSDDDAELLVADFLSAANAWAGLAAAGAGESRGALALVGVGR